MAKTIKFKKSNADALAADATVNQFEYEGKKYNAVLPIIVHTSNGQEKLTPADICVHTEAQKILVESGASCIQEVTE